FEEPTARRLVSHFGNLLRAVASHPAISIETAPLMDTAELKEAWAASNGPAIDHPVNRSYAQAFEDQVAGTPERIAAVAGTQTISYADLNRRANRIGYCLKASGAAPNTPVAVLIPRGLDYLAALVGIVKAGAAFLPLDTGYPYERLRYMLDDSGASILISTSD